jgi:hypothetical protein
MRMRIASIFAATALVISACSSPNEEGTVWEPLAGAVLDIAAERRAESAAAQRPPLTREVLDTLDGEFLEVTRERTDQTAYLFVETRVNDGRPGLVTVWRTEDNVTLAMRNGVLEQTRGLGGGLFSKTSNVRSGRLGPSDGGAQTYVIEASDNKTIRLPVICEVVTIGSETIVIVERRHPTTRVQERCEVEGEPFVNDFWIDSRAGIVWQSRQWAGPSLGFLRTRQLTP